jgi:hypothetical protein
LSETIDKNESQNGFSLTDLRLSQDFENQAGVKKALTMIPIRRPDRQWFIRTHPDPAMRFETALLEFREEREVFAVVSSVRADLPGELVPVSLHLSITRTGTVFFWPVRLPREDGRALQWHESARIAAEMASRVWVRVVANMTLGAYEVFQATATLPEPEWPTLRLEELLAIAFKGKVISSADHPAVKRLMGSA